MHVDQPDQEDEDRSWLDQALYGAPDSGAGHEHWPEALVGCIHRALSKSYADGAFTLPDWLVEVWVNAYRRDNKLSAGLVDWAEGHARARGVWVDRTWIQPPSGQPQVYFVRRVRDSAIRIGYSSNPRGIMSRLRAGSTDELLLVLALEGTKELRDKLHRLFEANHLVGDWFEASPELIRFVQERGGAW